MGNIEAFHKESLEEHQATKMLHVETTGAMLLSYYYILFLRSEIFNVRIFFMGFRIGFEEILKGGEIEQGGEKR